MFLNPATVRTHISRAMDKLGARDRAQLVVFAVRAGLVFPEEPRRPFTVIVEGMAAVALALGASAVRTRRTWAWVAATGAHAIALAGVLWGIVAIAAGRGPHTQLNDTYHRVRIAMLGAGLILLLIRPYPADNFRFTVARDQPLRALAQRRG